MKKNSSMEKTYKVRKQQQQKKQLLFLIGVAAIIIAVVAGLIAKTVLDGKSDENQALSDDFSQTENEEVIVFEGKKYVYIILWRKYFFC